MRRPYQTGGAYSQFGPGPVTPVVKMLLIANTAVFVGTRLISEVVPSFWTWSVGVFGLTPGLVLTRLMVWQPFTYLFLHDARGFGHILMNMLVLWMFGVPLERQWGSRFFLRYYFVTGVGAGLAVILVSFVSPATYVTPTVGASGAIYGLLVAFAVYYPNTPILMFLLFPIPARYFVMIVGAIAFLSAPRGGGISHVAHLGGLIVGYAYLMRLRSASARRFGFGRLGVMADIKYRYMKWKMSRLKKRFDVYQGGQDKDWDRHVH